LRLPQPGGVDNPDSLQPHGLQHYYVPLAVVLVDPKGTVTAKECRRIIKLVAS